MGWPRGGQGVAKPSLGLSLGLGLVLGLVLGLGSGLGSDNQKSKPKIARIQPSLVFRVRVGVRASFRSVLGLGLGLGLVLWLYIPGPNPST